MAGLYHLRTEYYGGHPRVFHITTSTSSAYDDLVAKYGQDNVKRGDNMQPFVDAVAMCQDGRGDLIRVWPGTYTDDSATADATAVTISKAGITIESATGNPASVNISAGADAELFSIAATGDYTTIRNLMITLDTSATTPQDGIEVISGAVGVTIENVTFIGGDKATVAIDSEGDRLTVRNCRFEDVKLGIQSNGNYSVIEGNYINSDNTAAVGIELTAGNWCEVKGNWLDLSGGTGDTGLKIANGCLLGVAHDNWFHASCNDPISPGTSTMSLSANYVMGTVATDFTVTNSAALPSLVYT